MRAFLAPLLFAALIAFPLAAGAQEAGGAAPLPKAGPPPKFRQLAKGVETTIPVLRDAAETVAYHDVVDLLHGADLKWTPNEIPQSKTLAAMCKNVPFRRTIWNLEFTFKPLRMIEVDIPQPDRTMRRKTIWYMVYRVKNVGGHLKPKLRDADETVTVETSGDSQQVVLPKGTWGVEMVDKVDSPVDPKGSPREELKFLPLFVLESTNLRTPKAYTDHVIPVAIPLIQQREDAARKLLSTAEMAKTTIPLSTDRIDRSVWGVVTWEDVDPAGDFYSMYIQGLTNAYQWKDDVQQIKEGTPPGTGRTFVQRTLRLNFWRPGDEFDVNERELRFGIPGQLDYEWVWRP